MFIMNVSLTETVNQLIEYIKSKEIVKLKVI